MSSETGSRPIEQQAGSQTKKIGELKTKTRTLNRYFAGTCWGILAFVLLLCAEGKCRTHLIELFAYKSALSTRLSKLPVTVLVLITRPTGTRLISPHFAPFPDEGVVAGFGRAGIRASGG